MIDELLAKLSQVKQTGNGKWQACCPVHDDNDPSMSIREERDGKVLCYCFACGAKGIDVVNTLNLPVSVLFGTDDKVYDRGQWRKEKLLEEKQSDELFLAIYRKWTEAGKAIKLSDRKRHKQAVARLASINAILGVS